MSKLVLQEQQLKDEEAIDNHVFPVDQTTPQTSQMLTPGGGLESSDRNAVVSLGDLRKDLVSISLAYKSELQRNTEFE